MAYGQGKRKLDVTGGPDILFEARPPILVGRDREFQPVARNYETRIEQREQHFGGALTDLIERLVHSCERDRVFIGRDDIIEADDSHVFGDTPTELLQL